MASKIHTVFSGSCTPEVRCHYSIVRGYNPLSTNTKATTPNFAKPAKSTPPGEGNYSMLASRFLTHNLKLKTKISHFPHLSEASKYRSVDMARNDNLN